jgi:amidase
MSFAADRDNDIKNHAELLKPEVRWNVGIGHAAIAESSKIEAARTAHTRLFESVEEFFETHDMLVTPTVIVQPYDINM